DRFVGAEGVAALGAAAQAVVGTGIAIVAGGRTARGRIAGLPGVDHPVVANRGTAVVLVGPVRRIGHRTAEHHRERPGEPLQVHGADATRNPTDRQSSPREDRAPRWW